MVETYIGNHPMRRLKGKDDKVEHFKTWVAGRILGLFRYIRSFRRECFKKAEDRNIGDYEKLDNDERSVIFATSWKLESMMEAAFL